jgi:DSF synthase
MDRYSGLVEASVQYIKSAPDNFSVDTVIARENRPNNRSRMFDLGEVDVSFDDQTKTLWARMTPTSVPNINVNIIRDFKIIKDEVKQFHNEYDEIRYLVLSSKYPNVFNLGGDLNYFADLIEARDLVKLRDYTHQCVDVITNLFVTYDLPIITIALVQGDAFGGGFETALAYNVIIAERGARFSLPELLFGLFPAVGAHVQLIRLIGAAMAERMITSGKVYSAEELYDLGIVHVLADAGDGENAVRKYIKDTTATRFGRMGCYQASRKVNPITADELNSIADIWLDTALNLTPYNIKLMRRIAATQQKFDLAHRAIAS